MLQARYDSYPHLLRLLHWVLSASVLILILTGLSLHVAARPQWSILSGVVPSWLWTGRVYVWHYWAAVAFFPALLGSLIFLWQRRSWLRASHVILAGSGIVAIVTGLWMMFPFGSFFAIKTVVALHAAFGLVVLPLAFLWHAVEGLTKYVHCLVPSFRPLKEPRWMQTAADMRRICRRTGPARLTCLERCQRFREGSSRRITPSRTPPKRMERSNREA